MKESKKITPTNFIGILWEVEGADWSLWLSLCERLTWDLLSWQLCFALHGPTPTTTAGAAAASSPPRHAAAAQGLRRPPVAAQPGHNHLLQVTPASSFLFLCHSLSPWVVLNLDIYLLGRCVGCRVNRIDFEEVTVDLFKREHLSPEFKSNLTLFLDLFFLSLFVFAGKKVCKSFPTALVIL